MKKILIVIHNMGIGGAQKSLLSFLQCLAAEQRHEEYEIHVMPLDPTGEFLSQVPECFTVKLPGNALRWMGTAMNRELLLKHFSLRGLVGELVWMLRKRLRLFPKALNVPQRIWYSWKKMIPACEEQYDAAIAYMDGTPAYYVMDKVQAKKKVLWVHSDYQKQGYDPAFDEAYYGACDVAVTVSQGCREMLLQAHPALCDKLCVLENMSASSLISARSKEAGAEEFEGKHGLRLLSVGRLHPQKGMDIAVDAAHCLKMQGIDFVWLIVGEGSERTALEKKIAEYGLQNHVFLIGSRANPYVYMQKCDILIQPSRIEGKSIVLDEAKILCKPIVVTDYSTVKDTIVHGETGWIVSMTGNDVAQGIVWLWKNPEERDHLVKNLRRQPDENENRLSQYVDVMF